MFIFNNKKIITKDHSSKKGFTLIEMLVAVFVFSVIMTIAVGAIFSVVNANRTSQAIKSVMDNLSSAIDSMSRNIRYGTNYDCGGDSTLSTDCAEGDRNDFEFTFTNENGDGIGYKFNGVDHSIQKCDDSFNSCVRLTAPEVHIEKLHFYVKGTDPADNNDHPMLVITISGYAFAGSNRSNFDIETMVNQRDQMCKNSMIPYKLGVCL